MAIIATTSLVRASVLHATLNRIRPRHLVLEKFLFPNAEDYPRAQRAVQDAGAQAWVNTTRRLWTDYQDLQQELSTDSPVSLHVSAQTTHGIGSNAVHFLDLLTYITGRASGTLDPALLRPIENRRRHGSIEFEGAIQGYNATGDLFSMSTTGGSSAPLVVTVTTADRHIIIDETTNRALSFHGHRDAGWTQRPFMSPLQSQLTGTMIEELLTDDRCGLPSLAEATPTHLSLLDAYLVSYRAHVDPEAVECPVT